MPEPISIRCRENGPLVVPAAALHILDHVGNPFPLPAGKEFVALCRCGHTKNRPFCDGGHKTCGFVAADLAPAPAGAPPASA